jgi:hypothetical protein
LNNIISWHFPLHSENIIADNQCGFQRTVSATYQMFCIRQDSGQKNGRMYKLPTTLKKGYNPVPIFVKKEKFQWVWYRDEIN